MYHHRKLSAGGGVYGRIHLTFSLAEGTMWAYCGNGHREP